MAGWVFIKDGIGINTLPSSGWTFLTEEVGELSRAIRAIEIGRDHPGEHETAAEREYNLHEELADVMDQVLILCDKYDVDPDSLMAFSEKKLKKRFNEK